jgi:alpha-L-arabinofuranosidase
VVSGRSELVGLLDVSASRSEDGHTLHLAVINRSATETVTARLDLEGRALPALASARTLGADTADLSGANSIAYPDVVVGARSASSWSRGATPSRRTRSRCSASR